MYRVYLIKNQMSVGSVFFDIEYVATQETVFEFYLDNQACVRELLNFLDSRNVDHARPRIASTDFSDVYRIRMSKKLPDGRFVSYPTRELLSWEYFDFIRILAKLEKYKHYL